MARLLHGWAFHCSERAEHAAVALVWFEERPTATAFVVVNAGVKGHRFFGGGSALGACQNGAGLYGHSALNEVDDRVERLATMHLRTGEHAIHCERGAATMCHGPAPMICQASLRLSPETSRCPRHRSA